MLAKLIPLLRPLTRRGLATRFDDVTAAEILDDAVARYEAEKGELPVEPSVGGRLMVHLAALTAALYGALRERGVGEEEARVLTARVTWLAYDKMATVPTVLSRIGTPSKRARLERATRLFRKFPFAPPAYRMKDVVTDDDAVAFDVQRCPVAEYFLSRGLGRLCVESWCNLDYRLAERWEATLERRRTLAEGVDHCDFRWHPASTDEGGATGSGAEG